MANGKLLWQTAVQCKWQERCNETMFLEIATDNNTDIRSMSFQSQFLRFLKRGFKVNQC